MKIGIPRETGPGERRVAIIPETVKKLAAKRIETVIEAGAGMASSFSDAEYQAAGATVASSLEDLVAKSDAIVKVIRPDDAELARLKEGSALVCLQYPLSSPDFVKAVAARKLMTVALDMIPRTTLAQAMDVLSSQANLAGYWAVVAAASRLPKIFPMLMTAAGTVKAARLVVLGVGVAGAWSLAA